MVPSWLKATKRIQPASVPTPIVFLNLRTRPCAWPTIGNASRKEVSVANDNRFILDAPEGRPRFSPAGDVAAPVRLRRPLLRRLVATSVQLFSAAAPDLFRLT